jgi:hypothetical protein
VADWVTIFAGIAAAATVVTAGGVAVAARQVQLTKEQAQLDFEDDLAREYRSIIRDLPAQAFMERETTISSADELNAFFRYFDLSNEQLYLASRDRVSEGAITAWEQGILANAALPVFDAALESLKAGLPENYWQYLDKLIGRRAAGS